MTSATRKGNFTGISSTIEKLLAPVLPAAHRCTCDGERTCDGCAKAVNVASNTVAMMSGIEAFHASIAPPFCAKLDGNRDGLRCTLPDGHAGLCEPI